MSVDRVNNARMKKMYRAKTQQQQKDYNRNLQNLKKQHEITTGKRVKQNRETIHEIETSTNQRVKAAHGKMNEKVENMRDYYRARDAQLGENFRDENQRIKEEYAKRLNDLNHRYHRNIKSQVEYDTKIRSNIKTTFDKRINLSKRENEKRIEDMQESFRRSMEREQQHNLGNQTRVKRQAETEIERLQTNVIQKKEDFRRITTDLKENYDRNLDNLQRRQALVNKRRSDDTRKAVSNIRRIAEKQINIAVKRGQEKLGQQRSFLRTQHTKDVENFRKVNQEIRDQNAKEIEQLKFSYDQKAKESGRREELSKQDIKERYEERLKITTTEYQTQLNKMGVSYQKGLKKTVASSSAEKARLQRKFELTINQMNEAHQLQRNKMYNRALKSLKNIEKNYDKKLGELKDSFKTKEERQSKIYKESLSQIQIERENTVTSVTNRLEKRVELAKAWHRQKMKEQETAFNKERDAMRSKIGSQYTKLREDYEENLKNQKVRSDRTISSLKHNNTLLRIRDYNSMEETKLHLKDQAAARYSVAQARHLHQLRSVETARSKDIKQIIARMDDKNKVMQRNMDKKIAAMENTYNNRIDVLSEKNKKIKANYNREWDNLLEGQKNKIDKLNEDNLAARDKLRAEQEKQLDQLSKNHQEQLGQRGRQMAMLKNRYEGTSGQVARNQARNDSKLKRMQNQHFEEKKAMRDYYNERVDAARDSLKNERAELQKEYDKKVQRNEEDYVRLRDFSERKLDKTSSEYKMNTTRLKYENDRKLTKLQVQNKKALESTRGHYEGNIQNLNKTNRENLNAQKAAYDKELKDSQDAANREYHANLEKLTNDYEERMDKTIDGYEQRLASEENLKNRSIRQKDLSFKIFKQQQADQLELQQETNRESRRLMAEDNKKNIDSLRKEMRYNNSSQSAGAQVKIDNIEGDNAFKLGMLKLKHEKEIRTLDNKYKLKLKKERDLFQNELTVLKKNDEISQRKMENNYKERIDTIENEYRKRLKESEIF
ncbi:MAG: hypothetical protein E2O68_08705 [Deltaproteobacteria bacterium]|nr:MAG: hypothetical protein E2O68_08705 [Deltaproteobacteria bacterium]